MKAPSGSTPSWFTPLQFFLELNCNLLHRKLIARPFDCDPCGHPRSPIGNYILEGGGTVLTKRENGLKTPWPEGCVAFANPPYRSEDLANWMPRCRNMAFTGRDVVALVPAWPDRAWWQDWVETDRHSGRAVVLFVRGRLTFGWPRNPHGKGAESAKFPSAVIVWRRG